MSRRSGAAFILPLLGVVVLILFSFGDGPWGQWAWAVDLMTGSTVLTAPIVASCAAHLSWTQSRLDDLVDATPRAGRVPFRCAAQAAGWGVLGYVIGAVAISVDFLLRVHGGPFPLWAALIGLPVLGVAALVGALAARVFPYRITVLGVAPAVFLFGAFGPHPYGDLMKHGPVSGSLAGLEFARGFWLLQFAGLLALSLLLAGALLGAVRRKQGPGKLVLPALVVVSALAGLLACGSRLDDPGRHRLVASDERAIACLSGAPTICVAPSNRFALVGVAGAMERAAGPLREIEIRLPERYEESLPGYRPPVGVGDVTTDFGFDTLRVGARNIATPANCPQWHDLDVAPEKALLARELLVGWIRVRAGERVVTWSSKGQDWLTRSGTPGAISWVRSTFDQLRVCAFEDIQMPWNADPR